MQLKRFAIMGVISLLAGTVGACLGVWGVGEYRRYQTLLATTDAVVQVLQYNLREGTIKGIPAPAPPAQPGK